MVIIFLILPGLFFLINIYILKKRELISWDFKRGLRCYNCKDTLPVDEELIFSTIKTPDTGSYSPQLYKCCLMCQRDIKISQLNSILNRIKYKIKRFIIITPDKFYTKCFTLPSILLILLHIVLLYFNYHFLSLLIVVGILNNFYALLSIVKTFLITKKPQE